MRTVSEAYDKAKCFFWHGEPPPGDWLIAPCVLTRDSKALEESNWKVQLIAAETASPEDEHRVLRTGHFPCGWYEILIVQPDTATARAMAELETRLADCPVLDEDHYSQIENEHANVVWRDCYSTSERITYIREHRSQFTFYDMSDMIACVRGVYFNGNAGEIL